jgi:hypothetical protein
MRRRRRRGMPGTGHPRGVNFFENASGVFPPLFTQNTEFALKTHLLLSSHNVHWFRANPLVYPETRFRYFPTLPVSRRINEDLCKDTIGGITRRRISGKRDGTLPGFPGQDDPGQPELFEGLDHSDKLGQVEGFSKITIGVELVGHVDIRFRL